MIWIILIILATILGKRFNDWQLITGDHSVKNFLRHELTELKAFFRN